MHVHARTDKCTGHPGRLVVLSGMDGAGKSTQLNRLRLRLRAEGTRVMTIWSRGGYTPGMLALKSAVRSCSGRRWIPAAGPSADRAQAFQRPLVRRLWLTLAMLDLFLLYGVWIRLLRAFGWTVLCDRYLPDTALDFQLHFPQEPFHRWWLWRFLTWAAPRPDASFLLLISPAESQIRSRQKQEPFPDSFEALEQRHSTYQEWSKSSSWHVIDARRSEQRVAEEIDACLRSSVMRHAITSASSSPR